MGTGRELKWLGDIFKGISFVLCVQTKEIVLIFFILSLMYRGKAHGLHLSDTVSIDYPSCYASLGTTLSGLCILILCVAKAFLQVMVPLFIKSIHQV